MAQGSRLMAQAVGLVAALVISMWCPASARPLQSPAGGVKNPIFEVAFVKPDNSGGRGATMGGQPGRYAATNVTLRTLQVCRFHRSRRMVRIPRRFN
jgi:hypothetical protein